MRRYWIFLLLLGIFFACQQDPAENSRETAIEAGDAPDRPAPSVINDDNKVENLQPKSPTERPPILVTSVRMDDVPSPVMANKGESVYDSMCATCHSLEGPSKASSFNNLLEKRDPAWIMNFLYYPEFKVDPAKEGRCWVQESPMRRLNVIQARDFLEYLRLVEIRKG